MRKLTIEEELDLIELEDAYQYTMSMLEVEIKELERQMRFSTYVPKKIRKINWLREGF